MNFHGKRHRLYKLLQACSNTPSLDTIKPLHALTITLSPNPPHSTFLHNNFISHYATLNHFTLAFQVFDNMPKRNIVSYNTMISVYSRWDCVVEAWSVFITMIRCQLKPNNFTFSSLLSCASLSYRHGVQLQGLVVKNGLFYTDAFVGTALLGWFGRCGSLDDAVSVFEDMFCRSLVTWNSMISLFCRHGYGRDGMVMFLELLRGKVGLSESSFVAVLSGVVCDRELELGEQIHGWIIKSGFDCVVSVVNSLIKLYVKCGNVDLVENMLEKMVDRDVVTWNTVISGLASSKKPGKAFEFFAKMFEEGIKPNQTTYVGLINSCTSLLIPMHGESFHAKAIINGFESHVYVGSALVDYYAKCDKLDDAYFCFVEINEKNVVSWNSLLTGYANKSSSAAICLLRDMLESGCQPNEFSFSAVLKSLSVSELQQAHCLTIKLGFEDNEYVMSSLIASYGSNGLISDALTFVTAYGNQFAVVPSNNIAAIYNRSCQYHETLKLLSQLEEPDIVSWNIALAACARHGNYREVLGMFKQMLAAQIHPDKFTYVSLLVACTKLCDFGLGSSIHGLIIKSNYSLCDVFVCNMLIDMYGKCGSVESSVKIFDDMKGRNLLTWTTLISALGINSCASDAVGRFKEMEIAGFQPDKVVFLSILTACKHGGLVREGVKLFEKMKSYGIEPGLDHYHCIVDLLARHGHLKETEEIIHRMPIPPNALIWRTFLEGCSRYMKLKKTQWWVCKLEHSPEYHFAEQKNSRELISMLNFV